MIALLLGLAWAGPCDPAGVKAIVEALPQVGAEHQVEMSAMGLAEACPGHAGLAGAAAMVAQMPPEHRTIVDAKAATDDPMLWIGACVGGLQVAAKSVQVAPSEKRPMLWRECDLHSKGWFSESEWNAASGLVFISLEAGHALSEGGFDPTEIRTVVRGLAGIGGSAGGGGSILPPPPEIEPIDFGGIGLEMPEVKAGFVERPKVKWNRSARNAKRNVCKLVVTVRKSGELGKVDWSGCPEPLRKSVEKALKKAEFEVATEGGEPVRSTFKTRFTVR